MINIESISKKYAHACALNCVMLNVPAGKIYALFGPNGAGKTTALKIMSGLMEPDSGDVKICGKSIISDPVNAKFDIGFLADQNVLFDYMSGTDYLNFTMDIFKIPESRRNESFETYLDAFEMRHAANDFIFNYTFEMKRKFSLIAALSHKPKVLLLDEPASGMDQISIGQLKKVIRDYAAKGNAVLFSTNTVEIAANLCDIAAVISGGNIIECLSPEELRKKFGERESGI